MRLNPAVTIVSILIGAELLGILGALIAVPVAASIGVVASELLPPKPDPDAGISADAAAEPG